jgi:hypothetical protein
VWDCENCGCQAIAGSLEFCPVCREPRPIPDAVPAEEADPVLGSAADEPEGGASPAGAGSEAQQTPDPAPAAKSDKEEDEWPE